MITFEPQPERRLLERSLSAANAVAMGQMHQWGQYHKSRMSLHVLAYLAYPDDPQSLWDAQKNEARLARAPLNLEALCALAASFGLQADTEEESRRALGLFDLAFQRTRGHIPAEYQALHVISAHLSGRQDRVETLVKSYGDEAAPVRKAIRCRAAHPRNGGSAAVFMQRLRELTGWTDLCEPDERTSPSINGLRTEPGNAVENGPLITVIMTCFRPDEALLAAVRSIAAQTWQNWELIVVDDGSGPEYSGVLRDALNLDSRVRLLIQPENGGTYQARNRAMAAARGEFITGLDSDDWAHPRRLENQVKPLLDDPKLVMVESRSLAVHEDLSPVVDPQVAVIASRSTLIMVRAKPIRRRIGFYDEVRKTADSEFRMRIKEHFGRRAWTRMKGGPLTLVRHTDTTLSAGEVSRYWMTTSRLAYHSGFTHWHQRIRRGRAEAFLEALARPRPFPITQDITRTKAASRQITYARIYTADWSTLDKARRTMLAEAAEQASRGQAIGLAHCPEWVNVNGKRPLINWSVLETAADHGLEFVDLEPGEAAPVITPTEQYAELLRFEHPELEADRIRVHSETSERRHETMPSTTEVHHLPPTPRRLIRWGDLALAGTGLLSAGAVAAASAVWQPDALPWATAGSLAIWLGAGGLAISRRISSRILR